MHHLADSMTELCHSGKHNNASEEGIPMYYISGEEAKLVVIGRGRYLSVCHGVNEFGLPAFWNKLFSIWNGNKVICNIVQNDYAGIYAPKTFLLH